MEELLQVLPLVARPGEISPALVIVLDTRRKWAVLLDFRKGIYATEARRTRRFRCPVQSGIWLTTPCLLSVASVAPWLDCCLGASEAVAEWTAAPACQGASAYNASSPLNFGLPTSPATTSHVHCPQSPYGGPLGSW